MSAVCVMGEKQTLGYKTPTLTHAAIVVDERVEPLAFLGLGTRAETSKEGRHPQAPPGIVASLPVTSNVHRRHHHSRPRPPRDGHHNHGIPIPAAPLVFLAMLPKVAVELEAGRVLEAHLQGVSARRKGVDGIHVLLCV